MRVDKIMKIAKKLIVGLLIVGTINCSQNTNQNAAANATLAAVAAYLATRPLQAPAPVTFAPPMVQFNQYNPVFNVNPFFQSFAQQPLMPTQGINQLLLQLQAAQALRQANAQLQQNNLIAAAAPQVVTRLPFVYATPNTNSSANGVPSVATPTQPQQSVSATAAAHNAVNTVAAPARVDHKAASESAATASAASQPGSQLGHSLASAVSPREIVCTCNARFNAIAGYKEHVIKEYVRLPESECTRKELMGFMKGHLKMGSLEGIIFGKLSTGVVTCRCSKKFNNEDLWENHVRTVHRLGKHATTKAFNNWKHSVKGDDESYNEEEVRERTASKRATKKSVSTKKRKKDDSEDEPSSSESDSDDGDSAVTQRSRSDDDSDERQLPKAKHRTPKSEASSAAGGGDGTPSSKPQKRLKKSSPDLEAISCYYCFHSFQGFDDLSAHLRSEHTVEINKEQYYENYKRINSIAAAPKRAAVGAAGSAIDAKKSAEPKLPLNVKFSRKVQCPHCIQEKKIVSFPVFVKHLRERHQITIQKMDYADLYEKNKVTDAHSMIVEQQRMASAPSAGGAVDPKLLNQSSYADLNKKFVCICNKGFNVSNEFKNHVIKEHQIGSYATEASLNLYLKDYLKKGNLSSIKAEQDASKRKARQSKCRAKERAQVKAQSEQAAGVVESVPAVATFASAANAAAQALAAAELAAKTAAQVSAAAHAAHLVLTPEEFLSSESATAAATEKPAAVALALDAVPERDDASTADVKPTGAAAALDGVQADDKDLDDWLNVLN